MSHVVVANLQPLLTTENFQGVWKLTRAMIAAGWKYKASADALGTGTNKDTSANEQNDKWGVGGGVNLTQVGAQTGTASVIGAVSATGFSIVSSVSGFVANSVGRFLKIAGALNANNNGIFQITAQSGTTVTIFNPGAVAETTPALSTWTEMQGGASATIATAGTGGAFPGRAIVTGLTGMVAPTTSPLNRGSVGDFLTFVNATVGANNGCFRITRVISTTSVEIDNPNALATGETHNGSIIWTETSTTAQIYPTSLQGATGQGAWIVLEGPDTLKIPIGTNVPTGTFLRGEKVTQTTSGATGTIQGLLTDAAGGTGYLVIAPRLNGTGGGVRGWTTSGTDTLTGATSGATVTTANITPIQFVREMVFWKSTQAAGHIYVQCVDQNLESVYRFSAIAATASVTNVVAPGTSAGAGFPVPGSYVMLGTGSIAAVTTTPINWGGNNGSAADGNFQIMVANCIPNDVADPDGSWTWAMGTPANATTSYAGMCFMRCEDAEDADVDPYVTSSFSATVNDGVRLGPTPGKAAATDFFQSACVLDSNSTSWKGWRRRGFATGDAFQNFCGQCLTDGSHSPEATTTLATGIWRVQHALSEIFIREPIWIASMQFGQRMRKGTLRWIFMTEGGVTNLTYQGGAWVQLSCNQPASCVAGPWDQQTTPTNS